MRKWSYKVADKLIDGAIQKGYDVRQISEGCLGSGDWLILSPTDGPDFVILEAMMGAQWIIPSNKLLSKDAWRILTRFAYEGQEYLDTLKKLSHTPNEEYRYADDPLVLEKKREGYNAVYSSSGVLLVSPDKRPSYALFETWGETTITSCVIDQNAPADMVWNAMVAFGEMAGELRDRVEEAA